MSSDDVKKYYWMKLKPEFFTKGDVKLLRKKENGAEYIIFWQQLLLLSVESSEIGILRYKENMPYTPDILSTLTDTNIDVVKGALSEFVNMGMITINGSGDIILDEIIQELIGSHTGAAKRKSEYRQRIKSGDIVPRLSQNVPIIKEKKRKEKKRKEKKEGKAFIPPVIDDVVNYFVENGYSAEAGKKAFNFYAVAEWNDSRGTPVRNWKQKMIANWFKPDNKIKPEDNKPKPKKLEFYKPEQSISFQRGQK